MIVILIILMIILVTMCACVCDDHDDFCNFDYPYMIILVTMRALQMIIVILMTIFMISFVTMRGLQMIIVILMIILMIILVTVRSCVCDDQPRLKWQSMHSYQHTVIPIMLQIIIIINYRSCNMLYAILICITIMMFFNIIDRWGIICGLQNQNMKRGKYCYQHTIQSFFKLSSDDQSYFKQIKTIFCCIHKGRLNDYQHH